MKSLQAFNQKLSKFENYKTSVGQLIIDKEHLTRADLWIPIGIRPLYLLL